MLDHYKTLGVPRNASRQEIKRAFRALAKKYHPDRNAARAQWATAQIKRLIEAHRVLSHAGLRESYDRHHAVLHEREKPQVLRPPEAAPRRRPSQGAGGADPLRPARGQRRDGDGVVRAAGRAPTAATT